MNNSRRRRAICAGTVVPMDLAHKGLACHCCMKMDDTRTLKFCNGCKMVLYCSKECQRRDWKVLDHKTYCRAVQMFRRIYHVAQADAHSDKVGWFIGTIFMNQFPDHETQQLSIMLRGCRICSHCRKSQYELDPTSTPWKNCPTCLYGWCCSKACWSKYRRHHTPQTCEIYQRSTRINMHHWYHIHDSGTASTKVYVPPTSRKKPLAPGKFPNSWDEYFQLRCPDQPMAELEPATRLLSQAATCLYVMYKHGIQQFLGKSKLLIHVAGTSPGYDGNPSIVWEEILHMLPSVKDLETVFIGPEACNNNPTVTRVDSGPLILCPNCKRRGKTRSCKLIAMTYHDFVNQSSDYRRPDLIIAFNPAIFYETDTESWKTSVQCMMDLNVPAYFTAYMPEDADPDFAILRDLRANLVSDEPFFNPFADLQAQFDTNAMDKFYFINMLCMGFQGRREATDLTESE